jgi:hypothetical protein
MSESTQEDNDNTKTSDLTTADEALIQTNLDEEATEPQSNQNESLLHQDEIQMTLKEFTQKLRDNDRSIKRIEESMATLYDKLERAPKTEELKVSSKKESKKKKKEKLDKKGKKEKKLDKKGKKEKKLDKKGKKEKKLDKKGKKKSRKTRSDEKTKLAKAITNTEKKNTRRTNSKGKKGRMKNAANKK